MLFKGGGNHHAKNSKLPQKKQQCYGYTTMWISKVLLANVMFGFYVHAFPQQHNSAICHIPYLHGVYRCYNTKLPFYPKPPVSFPKLLTSLYPPPEKTPTASSHVLHSMGRGQHHCPLFTAGKQTTRSRRCWALATAQSHNWCLLLHSHSFPFSQNIQRFPIFHISILFVKLIETIQSLRRDEKQG